MSKILKQRKPVKRMNRRERALALALIRDQFGNEVALVPLSTLLRREVARLKRNKSPKRPNR